MFYLHLFLGLIFGSFLNVLVLRLPKNVSIIKPGSQCFYCKHPIKWYYNIPLISFFYLNRTTICCSKKIPIQYPIVELSSMLLWIWSYFYLSDLSVRILFLIISSILLVIILTDFYYFIIPLELNIFMILSILCFKFFKSSNIINETLMVIIFCAIFILIISLISRVLNKDVMGFGDIILIGVISIWLNFFDLLIIIFFSTILSLLHWLLLYAKSKKSNIKLPFGSSLSLITIIYYIFTITFDIKIY